MKTNRVFISGLMSVGLLCCLCFTSFAQVQPLGTIIGRQTVIEVPNSASTMSQALIYYPDDYFLPANANKKYPIFIFLHGVGEGTTDNIKQLTNTSLPQLIGQGLNPYGIDTLTGDTAKFIIVSPHKPSKGDSYDYFQVKYMIPYLLKTYRVDTTCVWLGGLSAGARGTFSVPMEDSVLGKKLAGIMPLANGGYDNNMAIQAKVNNLNACMKNGMAAFLYIGTQDPGYNAGAVLKYNDTLSRYAKPGKYIFRTLLNAGHNSSVWNPPFAMASRIWNPKYNAWDQMASTHTSSVKEELTVSAGSNKNITLPTNSVTLTGVAIPILGTTIASFKWAMVSGPNTPVQSAPNAAVNTVSSLIAGTYVFRLSVTTSILSVAVSDVTVIVSAASNVLPVVNAGIPIAITLPVNSVTMAGSASDSDGSISSVKWTQVSGGAATISNAASLTTSITGLVAGTYVFKLTATDNSNATASSDVQVVVSPLVVTPPPVPAKGDIIKAALTEYKSGFLGSNGLFYTYIYNNISGKMEITPFDLGGRKVVDVTAGFNVLQMLDDNGYVWRNIPNGTATPIRFETDTTGKPFDKNIAVYGYYYTNITIRTDGSLWYWGRDDYNLYAGSNYIEQPIQLSPAGMKFKKVVMGWSIIALTTTGEVYQWTRGGSLIPTKRVTPRPAIDIFASHYNYNGCIIPDATGDQTMGYPYMWGSEFSFWGGNAAYTEPTSVKALWGVTAPIKEVAANNNTIHYIDSLGRMFGLGDNANGEVGNGEELVNHADIYPTPYAWSWNKGEKYTGAPAIEIGKGIKWEKLFKGNAYAYYVMALDANGSLYSWGRQKSLVLGNGFHCIEEAVYPNSLDVLKPTLVTPLKTIGQSYNFKKYTINAGADQTVTGTTATLSGSGTPSTLKASGTVSNGMPDISYKIVSYLWTKLSGTGGVITTPNSASTTLTGLTPGKYTYKLLITDNNTGTIADTVIITVNSGTPVNQAPVASAGFDKTIILPVSSTTLDGSATDSDGSISTYAWTKISGPTQFTIATPGQGASAISNLVQGIYSFELEVTDDQGAKGKDTVSITVLAAANISPVANGGGNKTITLPVNNVTVTGSGTDADGTIKTYAWTKIAGPAQFSITSPAMAVTTITNLVEGTYQFQLQVTDDKNATDKDLITVTVLPPIVIPNVAPIASGGGNKTITLPVNTTTLTGSGTDADGTIKSYLWTKKSGPAAFVIGSPATAATSINNLTEGVYEFQLQVTDNNDAIGVDVITITVLPAIVIPNVAPIAIGGGNKTITLPVNTVTLDGSGTDADGTIKAYAWTKISGPSGFTISNPSNGTTSVDNLVEGVYQFQLEVTDDDNASDKDVITVTVLPVPAPGNIAPVASGGGNKTITLPVDNVILSGTGSDVDGTIKSFLWTKVSGPSQYSIVNEASVVTAITGLVEGTYEFKLEVTDDKDAKGADVITVTVLPAILIPNVAPIANGGGNKTITLPVNSVSLAGSGIDNDGTIKDYSWTKVSGPASFSISSPGNSNTDITALTEGVYEFQLKVTDNDGATAIDIITVTVLPAIVIPNAAPIANGGGNITIILPVNTATLNGSGVDNDGTISSYSWSKISGPSGFTIANASNATTSVNNLTEGVYEFQLEVTDNDGATGKDIITITVLPEVVPVNIAPVANAGEDISIVLPISSVSLSASASYDPDGSIYTYSWAKISGPGSFTILNGSNVSTTVNNLIEGNYSFEVTVTDNKGAKATDVVNVTVLAKPNEAPIADAGDDRTVTLPVDVVTLDGSRSHDPEGSVLTYSWIKISGPNPFTILNSNTVNPSLPNLVAGTYVFELTVTDDKGLTSTDRVTIIVVGNGVGKSPTANAGPDQIVALPSNSTTLNGTSSVDPDGRIDKFEWKQKSGPTNAVINVALSAVTLVSGLVEGVYEFELTVTDNDGNSATSLVKITVTYSTLRSEKNVSVYPNPAVNDIHIKYESDEKEGFMFINIYDVQGKVVKTTSMTKDIQVMTETINVSSLRPGIYIIELKEKTGVKNILKFIKQ